MKSAYKGNMKKGNTIYSKSNTVSINANSHPNPLNHIVQKIKAQKTQMLTTMNSIVEEEDEMFTEDEEDVYSESETSSMQEEAFDEIEEEKSEDYNRSESTANNFKVIPVAIP